MPNQGKTAAERKTQKPFSNLALIGACLALCSTILLASIGLFALLPDRAERGLASSPLRYAEFGLPDALGPLSVVGAWTLDAPDSRFGGFSGLALDGGRLLAVSDSGVLAKFDRPGPGKPRLVLSELPGGPGDARFKKHRDSEAIIADDKGWWVAFERHHELRLYDRSLRTGVEAVRLPSLGWADNGGVEAMARLGDDLLLFPEAGGPALRFSPDRKTLTRMDPVAPGITDAAHAGRRLVLLQRRLTPVGFENRILLCDGPTPSRTCAPIRLPLGPTANAEALAIERINGAYRLWIMTDDNHQRPMRTLLIALDLPDNASGSGVRRPRGPS